jgi:putative membrane protein
MRKRTMTTDLLLASGHHLFVLMLVSMLAGEAVLLRQTVSAASLQLLARLDLYYGISAAGLLAFGVARLFWGSKGVAFYSGNPVFWVKLGTIAVIGLLSVLPTLAIARWRRAAKANPGALPDATQWQRMRRIAFIEMHLLTVVAVTAAAMARGIGQG